jgi:hypothetical protein
LKVLNLNSTVELASQVIGEMAAKKPGSTPWYLARSYLMNFVRRTLHAKSLRPFLIARVCPEGWS